MKRIRRSKRRVLILAAAFLALAMASLSSIASCSLAQVRVQEAELAGVRDGSYEGSYFILPVKVRVLVEVAGGRIAKIDILEHFNGRGKPAEAILDRILSTQSLAVEVVSGATYSSKTILKAVENALNKGRS